MPETESNESSELRCCGCMSFRSGMKLLFAWGLFWMWCWFMTAQFMWTGEYNSFNDGGFIARSVPTIILCTVLSFLAVVLTGMYLFYEDSTARSRLGLVAASATMLMVAVIFVAGGVPIMWIDIIAMAYSCKKTWEHYKELGASPSSGYVDIP